MGGIGLRAATFLTYGLPLVVFVLILLACMWGGLGDRCGGFCDRISDICAAVRCKATRWLGCCPELDYDDTSAAEVGGACTVREITVFEPRAQEGLLEGGNHTRSCNYLSGDSEAVQALETLIVPAAAREATVSSGEGLSDTSSAGSDSDPTRELLPLSGARQTYGSATDQLTVPSGWYRHTQSESNLAPRHSMTSAPYSP